MATREAGALRLGRLERSALTGVLVREIVNFSSFWRSSTFSSTVEPTIYFLAFGFGFGSLVSQVGGFDYIDFVATGIVATAVLFSSAFPAMFGTFVKYQFQRTYDAILAAPVDAEELVTAEALWIATRAGVYGCMPMVVGIFFGLDPSWGMLARPVHRLDLRVRLGQLRDHGRRLREVLRELQLRRQCRSDAALPRRRDVLSARQLARVGAVPRPSSIPCTSAWSSSVPPSSACGGGTISARVALLVVFGLVMWRIAIRAMTQKLVD